MRQGLQQEDNRSETNRDGEVGSQKKRLGTPERASSDLLKEIRNEMDKLRNAIKEKTVRSLDRMVRWTNSPFTIVVLECPVPSKFHLP